MVEEEYDGNMDETFEEDNVETEEDNNRSTIAFSPKFLNVSSPNELRRIKQSYRFLIDKLTFSNERVPVMLRQDIVMNTVSLTIAEFDKKMVELENSGDYFLLASNLANMYKTIFSRLDGIREGLLIDFRTMLVKIERGDFERKKLYENIAQLRKALELERKEKEEIRNQLHEVIIQKFDNRLIQIEELISSKKSDSVRTPEDSKRIIIEEGSDNKINNGKKDEAPTDDEIDEAMKQTIQLAHMESIDSLKINNLYPPHKQNDDKAVLDTYLSEGEMYYQFKGLDINEHMPNFMENASLYKDKPDNYLDDIFEFEKNEGL